MKVSYKKIFSEKEKTVLIPFFNDYANIPEAYRSWIEARVKSGNLSGKKDEHLTMFPGSGLEPERLVFWCFGKEEDIKPSQVRSTMASALKYLRRKPLAELAVSLNLQFLRYSQEIGEALALANYNTALFKTGQEKKDLEDRIIKKYLIVSRDIDKVQKYNLEEGLKIGAVVNEVRSLINSPHNLVNEETMARKAQEVCSRNKLKIRVFERRDLEKMKMGALLAVNEGSKHGAKMVVMEHLPLGRRQDPILLVGKGVTFDTGGVNIKPSSGLTEMHMDMAGAAAVLGVFMLLKDLEIMQNVIGIMPLTDNSLDSGSQKPSDVITTYSGKTVEVGNTDAEGRLILADAISYGIRTYKPSAIIDIATLTGACIVALGDQMAGMFGNNDQIKERMKNAALETDEEVWEMPIHEIHRKSMKGKFADLNNVDGGGMGGACSAAAFLEEFVEKTDWVHLDIAGPAMPKKPKEIDFHGASGYGVRLLIRFLQNLK
jgi:leucyl aminopeptidase